MKTPYRVYGIDLYPEKTMTPSPFVVIPRLSDGGIDNSKLAVGFKLGYSMANTLTPSSLDLNTISVQSGTNSIEMGERVSYNDEKVITYLKDVLAGWSEGYKVRSLYTKCETIQKNFISVGIREGALTQDSPIFVPPALQEKLVVPTFVYGDVVEGGGVVRTIEQLPFFKEGTRLGICVDQIVLFEKDKQNYAPLLPALNVFREYAEESIEVLSSIFDYLIKQMSIIIEDMRFSQYRKDVAGLLAQRLSKEIVDPTTNVCPAYQNLIQYGTPTTHSNH